MEALAQHEQTGSCSFSLDMGLIGLIFERNERDLDSTFIWLEMLASKMICEDRHRLWIVWNFVIFLNKFSRWLLSTKRFLMAVVSHGIKIGHWVRLFRLVPTVLKYFSSSRLVCRHNCFSYFCYSSASFPSIHCTLSTDNLANSRM